MSSRTFDHLKDFLVHRMKMSHVYQPVMLRELIKRSGSASTRDIASALLAEDRAQIDYYQQITKRMVGQVLTKRRGVTVQTESGYELVGFAELTDAERSELTRLCDAKIDEYLNRRVDPWSHRRKSVGYVPGTIRYEVLKRAHLRCELCGISGEVRALEVDHIVPRNKGGEDSSVNYQALCFSCNATKRDRDDTSFRSWAEDYSLREAGCLFCEIPRSRILDEDHLCYVIDDGFPVTREHKLVIPKRHVVDYFGLFQAERNAIDRMLDKLRSELMRKEPEIQGFNIGMNAGAAAGQTIFHCHVHLIPRRVGDTKNPRGGVRGVIPEKQLY